MGEAGAESPSTVVLGKKRDAMMTLWCLRELIVVDGEEERDGGQKPRPIDFLSRRPDDDDLPHR